MDKRNADERGQRRQIEAASFSPLELNSLYEGLQRLLAFNQPPKIEILLCIRFLDALVPQGMQAWQAFGWEVAGHLARRLPSVSLWGLSPAELGRIESILAHAQKQGSIPGQSPKSTQANLGAALDAVRDHQTKLDRLLRAAPGSTSGDQRPDSPGESTIMVPVIEKLNAAGHAPGFFSDIQKGSVVSLHVLVSDRSGVLKRGQPPPEQAQGVRNDDSGPRLFGPIPVRTTAVLSDAARRLDALGAWAVPAGRPRLDDCVVSVRFTPEEARLDGDSAGLAFVLAAATARASLAPGRSRIRVVEGLAATGVLEATSVAPVEPRTLEAKVEAAFFSQVRLLLVPASQESGAKACLDRLLRAYPHRDLSMRGVSDAAEIPAPGIRVGRGQKPPRTMGLGDVLVADARGAVETTASWVRWLGRSRWRTAAVFVIALAGFTMLGWEVYRHWPTPAEVRWVDDREIELRNSRGVVFRQIDLPFRPLRADLTPAHGLWFGVVGQRHGRAAKAVVIHGSMRNNTDLLSVIDWRGRVVWHGASRMPVPGWGSALEDYIWHPFIPLGDERCHRLLLGSRSRQWGGCILFVLDCGEGGEYSLRGGLFNNGHLERFSRWDVTGDGRKELLALGTHNGFLPDALPGHESRGRAFVAVLDMAAVSARPLPQDFADVPHLSSVDALDAGVLAVWTFAQDRFSNHERVQAAEAVRAVEGGIQISVLSATIYPGGNVSILYDLTGGDPLRPESVEVRYTDGYRAWIRHEFREIDTEEAIRQESERLRFEVMALTPEGWRPVEKRPDQLSARDKAGD